MRILYLFIFLCVIASVALVSKESLLRECRFCQAALPEKDTYSRDEDLPKKHTLDNGLAVILKSSQKVPLVAVQLVFKCGSATEGRFAGCGISHFLEHMIFKGTSTRTAGEIERQIKSYGGYINASTSRDTTEFHLTVKSEYLKEALELLADCVTNPVFDEAEFEKEREVISNEIRMNRDEPSQRVSLLLWENAYLSHPYRYPIIGEEGLFQQLKREDLAEYHRGNYIPNNAILSIVGDIDEEAALKAAQETFGKLPRGMKAGAFISEEPAQMSTRRAEEEAAGLNLSYLLLAFHSTRFADSGLYPLDVLAAALGQGESSRLHKKLVREKKLAYSVSAFNYTPKEPGLFMITLTLDGDKAEAALKETLNELEAIKFRSLSRAELKKIKRSVLSQYIYSKESIEARTEDYAMNYALTGDVDFSRRYIKGINDVKPADISKAAQRYLHPDNLTVAMLTPQTQKARGLPPPRAAGGGLEIAIEKSVLPNGTTLLIHDDRSSPVASINILFKGGVRAEDERTNGVSYLTSRMLLKGTASRSAEWISQEAESRGVVLSSFSGNNSFGISLKCLKGEFDFCLGLAADMVKNPSFAEEELETLRQIQLAQLKAQEEDIFETAHKELVKLIYKTHPYKMNYLGTEESVINLKRKDLLDFYGRLIVPENMVVAIFGDVGAVRARLKAAGAFGDMRRRGLKEFKVRGEGEQTSPRQSFKNMDKEQAVLIFGYPGVDLKNSDKYVFEVLNSMLTKPGGRIYMDIREGFGLSYALGSFSTLGIEPGFVAFYVATSPKDIDEVKRRMLNQIELLKAEGPTQEELDVAKKDLLGSYFRGLEINSDIGFRAGLSELYGLGYEDIFSYPGAVESVTAGDVMRVANKYFAGAKLNVVVISPKTAPEALLKSEVKEDGS